MSHIKMINEDFDNKSYLKVLKENVTEPEMAKEPLREFIYWPDVLKLIMGKLPKVEPTYQHGGVILAVGATVLATAIISSVTKGYQVYFSKAAKACKDATDKAECRKKFKINAMKSRIITLKKAKAMCKKSKDQGKCESKVEKEITRLTGKLSA